MSALVDGMAELENEAHDSDLDREQYLDGIEGTADDAYQAEGRSVFAGNPNTCSHGYRFENGLCPSVGCSAGRDVIGEPAAGTFHRQPIAGRVTQTGWRDGRLYLVHIRLAEPILSYTGSGRIYDQIYLTSDGPDWVNLQLGAAALDTVAERARHAEYQAYLCMMSDHGCECVALGFEQWALVVRS